MVASGRYEPLDPAGPEGKVDFGLDLTRLHEEPRERGVRSCVCPGFLKDSVYRLAVSLTQVLQDNRVEYDGRDAGR